MKIIRLHDKEYLVDDNNMAFELMGSSWTAIFTAYISARERGTLSTLDIGNNILLITTQLDEKLLSILAMVENILEIAKKDYEKELIITRFQELAKNF